MPLEDGRPRLKLSYKSAPFVFGNPLPPCIALEDDNGLPFGDVMHDGEFAFKDALGLTELLDKDCGLIGDVLIVLPKEEVCVYVLEVVLLW